MTGAAPASFSRFGRNTLALFLGSGLNTVLAAVVGILLVRHLGRAEYGLLTSAYAYLSFATLLATLGVDTVAQREVAREPERAVPIVSAALALRTVLSLGALLVAWAGLPFLGGDRRLAIVTATVTLSLVFSPYSLYLVGYAVELRQEVPRLAYAVWAIALSAAKLAMIGLGWPVEAFAAAEVVSATVVFLVARRLARGGGMAVRPRWRPAEWWPLLRESWPVAVALALIQISLRVDQLMLLRISGAAEVGLYGATVRLAELANVVPTVFMSSAFPILSRLVRDSRSGLDRATRLSFRAMAWVALPLAGFLGFWGEPLSVTLFGEAFREGGRVLAWLAWSVPFAFGNAVLYNRLFTEGKQRTAAWLAAASALANVALNALWIPADGAVGAARATALSYALTLLVTLVLADTRALGVAALSAFLRPAFACLVVVAVGGSGLGLGVWAGLGWTAAAYAALLVLSGEWGREELRVVRAALGR